MYFEMFIFSECGITPRLSFWSLNYLNFFICVFVCFAFLLISLMVDWKGTWQYNFTNWLLTLVNHTLLQMKSFASEIIINVYHLHSVMNDDSSGLCVHFVTSLLQKKWEYPFIANRCLFFFSVWRKCYLNCLSCFKHYIQVFRLLSSGVCHHELSGFLLFGDCCFGFIYSC